MKKIPSFSCYMDRGSNYGLDSLVFQTSEGRFWFSYKTLVAFKFWDKDIVCRQNDWGPTTGKHLNAIQPDHKRRVSEEEFKRLYEANNG